MRRFIFVITALFGMLVQASWVTAQSGDAAGVEITAPTSGSPIQGTVAIAGSTIIEGFISWEITFGYASDTTGTGGGSAAANAKPRPAPARLNLGAGTIVETTTDTWTDFDGTHSKGLCHWVGTTGKRRWDGYSAL